MLRNEMAYLWILYGALKSPAPAMYGIISVNRWFRILVAVVLTTAALPHATAQQPSPAKDISHNYVLRYDPYPNDFDISSAMKLIIAILIFAVIFIFFFSMHYRQFFDEEAAVLGADPRVSAFVNNRRTQQRFPCGLDASIIESFPVFVYSEVKGVKIGNEALECAVCISEFEDDENLRLLPKCHHVFHPDCIDAWLASHTTCPVCRANLTPEKLSGDESEQITNPIHSQENRSGAPEPVQAQNQVVIDVEPEEITRNSQPLSTTVTATATAVAKFPRSHSTGHSLVRPGDNCERYTLRLPEEIRNNIVRAQSCDVMFRLEASSRRGWRNSGGGCGDGNSRGRRGSDRWMFTMTPPFISKTGSIGKGDLEQSSSNACYPI